MKKTLYTIILLFIVVPNFAQNLFDKYESQLTPPRTYTCQRLAGKLKIDGKLDEEAWNRAKSTASFVDIRGEKFPVPIYNTTTKMMWDDEYLYIGAWLEEEDIIARLTERDTIIYYDNDFEVFINPEDNGINYFEIENNAKGVIFDLMLDKGYRSGGNFFTQWNCPGLKLAVNIDGSLNNSNDTDKHWTVEIAIPHKALTVNFNNPLKAGNYWRINFSRVQWLKGKEREENWVWSPTGVIDMHAPDRWGYLFFSNDVVGTPINGDFQYPYNQAVYKLLWAMFYEQKNYHSQNQNYIRTISNFFLTEKELNNLPTNIDLGVEATHSSFSIFANLPNEGMRYSVNENGHFTREKISKRTVKNWMWVRPHSNKSETEWKHLFKIMKDCGISGVMFEGYVENIYRWCKEAGLEAHHWKWTMNRAELMKTAPDWYAVNRNGESCYDKPAYVDYYRFLCPNKPQIAEYLADDYVKEANKPYVDGVHLDYVRMPDVILPVSLWKNYNIEQKEELPAYDYCYCNTCRSKFKAKYGKDPLELPYPMENQSWINFRLDAITNVVNTITKRVKKEAVNKSISAAVFPGPSMAKKMVRQDWGNWALDAYFPMIYNKFYYEGSEWIGRSVKESVQTVNGRAKIYAGLMFTDIKDEFEKALDAAFDNGASGVSFFDGPNEEYLQRFKIYLDKKGYIVK